MSDVPVMTQDEAKSALARDWLVARVVLIGGFVVAIAAIVWFGWVRPEMLKQEAIAALKQHQVELVSEVADLCNTGVSSAKDFGIVPYYAKLVPHKIVPTQVQGRYACIAATPATVYLVYVDLICRRFKEKSCVSLFRIAQASDGKVLYERPR